MTVLLRPLAATLLLAGWVQAQGPLDRSQLLRDLRALADPSMEGRGTGSDGSRRAQAYLQARMAAVGLEPLGPAFARPFAFEWEGPRQGVNLVGQLPGRRRPDQVLVLSAHYDHVGVVEGRVHPGADDNASGVAALLALAAYFKAHPPEHTLVFAFFDAEEEGLFGAKAFVAEMPFRRDQVLLDVNLDMVGRNDRGELYVAGTTGSPGLLAAMREVAARAPVRLRFGHDTGRGRDDWSQASDHGAFLDAGIPYLYFGVEDHADYHRPTDTADRIQPDFFARAAETVRRAVVELDGMGLGRRR